MQSDLLLFDYFLWAKSSCFNKNLWDLQLHVRAKYFSMPISQHFQIGCANNVDQHKSNLAYFFYNLKMSPTVGRYIKRVCFCTHTILITPLLLRSYQTQDTCDMNVLNWMHNRQTVFYRAQPLLIEKSWVWQLFINIDEPYKSRPESESWSWISLF